MAPRGAADDGVDVGVRQDDDRRFAAELERNPLQRVRRSFVDGLADERRARERDLVDAGMRDERCADRLAVARQDVDDAGREPGFDDEVAEPERRERRLLRRFQDAGAARCKSRTELPGRHHERKIPRNDLRHHTDRLAPRVGVDAPALQSADRHVERRAFDLRGPAGHVAEIVARAGHVHDARHLLRLAVVDALELGELVGVLIDEVGEPPDQRFALGGQHRRPGAALEGFAGGGDGFVDVRAARVGDRGYFGAGGRIDHGNALVRCRRHPFAADQEPSRPPQKGRDTGRWRWLGSDRETHAIPRYLCYGPQ